MGDADLSLCSSCDDFIVGQVLTLNVLPGHGSLSASAVSVRIRQLHARTLSCTMIVDILDDNHRPPAATTMGSAFLKLYDRRFAEQFRDDIGVEPWSKHIEQAYIDSVKNGAIYSFLHDLRTIDRLLQDTGDEWDHAQDEAYLAHKLLRQYNGEVAVYDAMREYQGRLIPKLIAAVDLDITPTSFTRDDDGGKVDFEPFRVKGVLLEYIKGCDLEEIVDHFPRSSWQGIVDKAIEIVRLMGNHNILNKDVNTRNFVVRALPDGELEQDAEVFMIDFGMCRLRGADESDLRWGMAKHTKDEEGAIGLVMKKMLSNHDFELHYEDARQYAEWADRDENSVGFYEE